MSSPSTFGRWSADPAIALDRQRRAGRAERAQPRQVAVAHRLDAGLQAAGVERGAGAEEGDAGLGGEAPQGRPVGGARRGRPGCRRTGRSSCRRAGRDLAVPHDPAGRCCTSGSGRRSTTLGPRSLCSADLQRLEHHAAVAVHDRLRQAGGAARVDDPERMVERQPGAARTAGRRRRARRSRGAARDGPASEADVGLGVEVAQQDRRGARSAARRAARAARAQAVGGDAAVDVAVARRSATFGSIWRKRSSTASGPMSAEHTDQIAPRLAQARKAIAVCGRLGRKARDPVARHHAHARERRGERRRPGGAARPRRSRASRRARCIASSRKTIAGWPAACAASAWRNTCCGVVDLRAGEPARARHRLVDQHAWRAASATRSRRSRRSTARRRAGRRTTSARGAS